MGRKRKPSTITASQEMRAIRSAKQLAFFIIEDDVYRENLIVRCRAGTVNPGIEKMIWEYVLGRTPETINLTVHNGDKDVSQLSDKELQAEILELRRRGEEVLAKNQDEMN